MLEAHALTGSEAGSWLPLIRGLIVDIDGVLSISGRPLPGVTAFADLLEVQALDAVFVTNNSTATRQEIRAHLQDIGLQVKLGQVLTSASATADYLAEVLPPNSSVLVVGESGLEAEIDARGFVRDGGDPEAVVIGMDRAINYQKIQRAATAIQRGAIFVACNRDPGVPREAGIAPGAGAMVGAVEATVGQSATVVGKPESRIFQQAVQRLGHAPQHCTAIGDNLAVDVEGAHRAGLRTVLLLSGISSRAQVAAAGTKPNLVYEDLQAMVSAWKRILLEEESP